VSGRILLVEDDPDLARVLRDNLLIEGFDVTHSLTGADAVSAARTLPPDLVVLDVTLPDTDGFQLCGALRQVGRVPIIMLTARSQKSDRLRGFELGADDYITKPFDLEELLARVRAVMRRARPTIAELALGDVRIDFTTRTAKRRGADLHLSDREFMILQYLAERADRLVSREELLRAIWGYADVPLTRSVDHAMSRLRKKLEPDAHRQRFIHTVHGDGYRLTPGEPLG
jgi:DNA-binding response OmpR family regulator